MNADEPLHVVRWPDRETTEESFSVLKRPGENLFRIMVRNLPAGITREGVRNLFLTVGSSAVCVHTAGSSEALVQFKSINEVELALRDLHNKPPYYLKIKSDYQDLDDNVEKPELNFSSKNSFSQKYKSFCNNSSPFEERPVECRLEDDDEKMSKLKSEVRRVAESLGYDPSLRMRQGRLDFKTGSYCISKGRGYMNMGEENGFVGGLQRSVFSSENGKAKDKMNFYCENCGARTTKMCWNCHASYCSLSCLRESSIDHRKCSTSPGDEVKDAAVNHLSDSDASEDGPGSRISEKFPEVTFAPGCTVLMTFYSSMRTVFLRKTDGSWDEKFARLCNDVALEVFKGERLEEAPEEGEVVAAKYYEDLCFYRARVLSKADSKISVLFIDFGNSQETRLEDLRPLSEPLRSAPAQALQVHLKDVSEDSTPNSVDYFNTLTAFQVPLILNFDSSTDEVVLMEKHFNVEVNKTVIENVLPSWKKTCFSFFGDAYYMKSMIPTKLEVSKTYSLIVSHFDEEEFRELGLFWVTWPDTDEYLHVKTSLRQKMMEYCNVFKDYVYLPMVNELCLAKENDEWYRCKTVKTSGLTCCLFFLDDGHFSFIETKNIRKMVEDFTEVPSQAVCCALPAQSRMTTDKELRSKVIEYLKGSLGHRVDSVSVLKLLDDVYYLSFPRVDEILDQSEADSKELGS